MFLNLCEKYWEWVSRKKYITEQGYTVVQFGDKWAVKRLTGQYKDLRTPGFSWTSQSHHFSDCLASKDEIERRFGKISEK